MHLLLPSNVAPKTFPKNEPNHYYTPLSLPLHLEGDGWKVALKEITYQNNILKPFLEVWQGDFDPQGKAVEVLHLTDPSKVGKYIMRTYESGKRQTFSLNWQTSDFLQKYLGDDITFQILLDGPSFQEYEFFTKESAHVTIPVNETKGIIILLARVLPKIIQIVRPMSSFYLTVKSLCEELNRTLSKVNIRFSLDKEQLFELTKMPRNYCLVLRQEMHHMLGFEHSELMEAPQTATHKADLERHLSPMFVYCDLVEPIVVGDTLAPLLRMLHLPSREHGAIVNQVFDPPLYLKVSKRQVQTIEISMRTERGDPFPLSPEGKAFLTLHILHDSDK